MAGGVQITLAELSRLTGVGRRTIMVRLKDAAVAPSDTGKRAYRYPSPEALRAILSRGGDHSKLLSFDEGRTREVHARADRAEHNLAVVRGLVISEASATAVIVDIATKTRSALMSVGPRIAPELVKAFKSTKQPVAIVTGAIVEALRHLGDEMPTWDSWQLASTADEKDTDGGSGVDIRPSA